MSGPDPDARAEPQPADVIPATQVRVPMEAVGATGKGRSVGVFLKDIALFFAAPFVTIAYLALFPFIGATMLVRTRGQKTPGQACRGSETEG